MKSTRHIQLLAAVSLALTILPAMPTVLFLRVFISGRDHYVVFNPK